MPGAGSDADDRYGTGADPGEGSRVGVVLTSLLTPATAAGRGGGWRGSIPLPHEKGPSGFPRTALELTLTDRLLLERIVAERDQENVDVGVRSTADGRREDLALDVGVRQANLGVAQRALVELPPATDGAGDDLR